MVSCDLVLSDILEEHFTPKSLSNEGHTLMEISSSNLSSNSSRLKKNSSKMKKLRRSK